ncbi:extracellular catalytic domain type 1 short-chain-length polyhydroxyalkanoate depolymerase [Pseudoduganella umbonata]|uniref:PHB depolymerase family esterase n=1 Tax=Pseudoduganella umbonata TaxID=864828 RepID=A0A4P8I0I8_9BURK|nr:PHB depolymerase family esterase [Pseudoduganella umbonata]MBB3221919.1 poly(hydroxyalkanoate) depolymerase family esterase [Pseudoduganella umbonata]QCP14284.1 PHB depolymerase family esterase [Pseudoduganella umbonata]
MIQTFCEQWTRLAFLPLNLHSATNDPVTRPDPVTQPGVSGNISGTDGNSTGNASGNASATPAGSLSAALSGKPRFISRTFDSGHGSLAYKLYVPASFTGHEPTLVVMLHGYGQSAEDFANGTDMNRHAEEAGCLVMYPEQTCFGMVGGCWNWFDRAHQQRDHGDAALIAGATREVAAEFLVPSGKVFVAGLSAGAAMAVVLGCTYPDLYSAVGCHSGLPHGCAGDTASAMQAMRNGATIEDAAVLTQNAVPVIVFHGDNDQTVHSTNGRTVIEHSLSAVRLNDAARPQVVEESGVARDRGYTRVVHRGADGAILAEHWVIHGAGHAWSGGSLRGSYADDKGPSASGEMLRFFRDVQYPVAA